MKDKKKHNQLVDFSHPNADKIKTATTQSFNLKTNKGKQTAVEWLFKELNRIRIEDESGNIGTLSFFIQQDEALKQAKEMEKQQIIDAVTHGNRQEVYDATETIGQNYYNETYEAKEM